MKTILSIEGMSCENCVKHVKTALEALEGVQSAEVSLDSNSAEVEHNDGLDPSVLYEAIEEEGYQVLR